MTSMEGYAFNTRDVGDPLNTVTLTPDSTLVVSQSATLVSRSYGDGSELIVPRNNKRTYFGVQVLSTAVHYVFYDETTDNSGTIGFNIGDFNYKLHGELMAADGNGRLFTDSFTGRIIISANPATSTQVIFTEYFIQSLT